VAEEDTLRLEGALRTLGRHLEVPPAPAAEAVSTAVLARLRTTAPSQPRRQPALRYAIVIMLLLVAGVIITVPPVRAAVLELLRVGGITVHQGEGPPLPDTPTLEQQPVADLAQARQLAGVRAEFPELLGQPQEILVVEDRVVSLIYHPTADRPAIRLDAMGGQLEPGFEKFLRFNDPHEYDVGGATAWYVPGPHEIAYRDASGQLREESARMAAATLIWESLGTTYRLEADLPPDRLAEIARSVPI
jgi:hypothetical protein